jgi:hypothetical protein
MVDSQADVAVCASCDCIGHSGKTVPVYTDHPTFEQVELITARTMLAKPVQRHRFPFR